MVVNEIPLGQGALGRPLWRFRKWNRCRQVAEKTDGAERGDGVRANRPFNKKLKRIHNNVPQTAGTVSKFSVDDLSEGEHL